MAKRQKPAKSQSTKSPAPDSSTAGNQDKPKESWRDTLESVVFAFVLAFLFRTFEAEAFVIPTGSMAPTLRGRHKETVCERCGYPIVIGASDEVDSDTGYLKGTVVDGELLGGVQIQTAICPNCRYENQHMENHLGFNGDRILVNKYPYEFGEPHRFDVFVFKWPEQPETNYIKRLVGLPNETIRIRQGDLYRWDPDQDPAEQILRKDDPDKQAVLQLPVYDDDYSPTGALAQVWPSRWAGMRQEGSSGELGGWVDDSASWPLDDTVEGRRVYHQAATGDWTWLRYRNYVPASEDWEDAEKGRSVQPHAQLITDFCGYNAYTASGPGGTLRVDDLDYGPFWVPDLTVSFDIDIEEVADDGELLIELVEGVYRYRCRLNLSTGQAELFHVNAHHGEDDERNLLTAECPIDGPGEYEVRFANVDDRLCLWVDGDLVDFGPEAAYQRFAADNNLPTNADLTPVGIAVRGADVRTSGLLVERDIYYRAEVPDRRMGEGPPSDAMQRHGFQRELAGLIDEPQAWAEVYNEGLDYDTVDLVIGPDHYLAMGDNSPRSSDSRLWEGEQTVPREFLVGKAFFIYWPHGEPFLNGGEGYAIIDNKAWTRDGSAVRVDGYPKYTIPFYPQISRMKRIR